MDTARPATRDSSLPRLFGLLLHFLHYDRLPEMVYGLRDNLYTTPIKRGRQREKKRERKSERKVAKEREVSNRKVKECCKGLENIADVDIARARWIRHDRCVFFEFFTLQQLELFPSAVLAPRSFQRTKGARFGARVDRLSYEIRTAIKFRGYNTACSRPDYPTDK